MPVIGIRKRGIIMRVIYKLLIIAACFIPVQAFAIEKLSVSELLDRYAANHDKLRSVIAKTEETITNNWSNKPTPSIIRWVQELRLHGNRKFRRFYRWLNLPAEDAPAPLEEADSFFLLWDGKCYFEYYKPMKATDPSDGRLYFSADKKYAKYILNFGWQGAPFLGVRFSNSERIDSVLRQADSISVRDKLDQVDSVGCYVIEAKAKSGAYTVWLDPGHGYNIVQADIRVGPNNLYRGRRLKDDESYSLSVRNVRFKNIDGVWIPMEADLYSTCNKQNGVNVHSAIHHKITQITLDPNHEAMDSFVPAVENGTEIRDLDSRATYTWQDDMKLVVDERDGSIRYVSKEWSILVGVGKPLPQLEGIKLKLSTEQAKNRAILLCFFDMKQRPSRYCIKQLAQKAAGLKEKGVTVAAVQTSQVTEKTLNEWIKKYNILFPLGAITADIEKTRFAWGVRSLPWLILTDKQHIVTAEGFAPAELDEKLDNNSKH